MIFVLNKKTWVNFYKGGPVGVETIAAALSEQL
jgi:Holliday junction resolvasome RuvABC ATP-dependent DNA helicase subunit